LHDALPIYQLLRPPLRISATDREGRPSLAGRLTLADQLALANRHPGDAIAGEAEGERGPPVGIGRCPVTDDGDPVALGRDLFGREDAGASDEFLFAPGLDGLTSGEFAPAVIDGAVRSEGVDEALLVVRVYDVDDVGDDGRDLQF